MKIPKMSASQFSKLISLDPWDKVPVSIEEFVLSPHFLNLSEDIYPRVYDILVHIFGKNPKEFYNYNDVNFMGGIGCLTGDTKIIDSNGNLFFLEELVDKEIEIFCYDEINDCPTTQKAKGKASGKKEVYCITTESGRKIRATANHLFLTDQGWKPTRSLVSRGILTANKLPFKDSKKYLTKENINKIKYQLENIENAEIDWNFLNLATYNKNSLLKLMEHVKSVSSQDYDLYPNSFDFIRPIGLRTGEIFTKQDSHFLRFRHKSDSIPNLLYDRVIDVKFLGEEETYDLEVPVYENFILYDGTIVHNSGKTYLGAIAQSYLFYKFNCLKDSRRYFGQSDDKPITFANCAPSAHKAQKLVYQSIKENVTKMDFFKQYRLLIQSKEIKKYNHSNNLELNVYSGSSTANSVIGFSVFSCIIDETCFFEKSSERDYFEDLYKGVKARISSRFGDKGFMLCMSSPKNVDDYAWRMVQDLKSDKDASKIILPKSFKERMSKPDGMYF